MNKKTRGRIISSACAVLGVTLTAGVFSFLQTQTVSAEVNKAVVNNILTTNFENSVGVKDASSGNGLKYYDSETQVGENETRYVSFNASFDVSNNKEVRFVYSNPNRGSVQKSFNSQRAELKISSAEDPQDYVTFTYYTLTSGDATGAGQTWWANAYKDGVKSSYEVKPSNDYGNAGKVGVSATKLASDMTMEFAFDKTNIVSSNFGGSFQSMFGTQTGALEEFRNVFDDTDRINVQLKFSHFDKSWGGTNGVYAGGRAELFIHSIGGQSLATEATDVLAPYASELTLSDAEYLQNTQYTFKALTNETDLYVENANDLWSAKNLTYTLTVKAPDDTETTTEITELAETTVLAFTQAGRNEVTLTVYDEAENSYQSNTVLVDVKAVYSVSIDGITTTVKEGENFVLPEKTETGFIGYVSSNKLYFAGEEVAVSSDMEFVSQSLTITSSTPSVRYENEPYGLRFTSEIDEAEYLALKQLANVSFGTLILPENMVDSTGGLNVNNSNVLNISATHISENYLSINAVVTGMKKANQYQRRLSAVVYVKVEKDGEEKYFYYTPVTYSLKEVAQSTIDNGGLTSAQLAILNTFVTEEN